MDVTQSRQNIKLEPLTEPDCVCFDKTKLLQNSGILIINISSSNNYRKQNGGSTQLLGGYIA